MKLTPTRRLLASSAALAICLGAVACGSDDDTGSDSTTTVPDTVAGGDTTTTAAESAGSPITILVSNDDGYSAEGIDALVEGLKTLPEVELIVYAPLEQQSGTGGSTTDGPLEVTDVELASGTPARAVAGYPADTIRVAIDDEGVEADLVITGINEGQNIGPITNLSGTVGAARAAASRGVPALATSSGSTGFDYEAAVPLILDWVSENRDAIAAGELPAEVSNLNVPSCPTGEIRGLVEVETAAALDPEVGSPLDPQDCASTIDESEIVDDVAGFLNGFAVLAPVPVEAA